MDSAHPRIEASTVAPAALATGRGDGTGSGSGRMRVTRTPRVAQSS
jgi:hypothetical protein